MAVRMAMAIGSARIGSARIGYKIDVSCSPMDYARSLNHTKQQSIKRNGRK